MRLKLLFTILLASSLSYAQVIPEQVKPPSWGMDNMETLKPFKLPAFDLKKLQEEDVINDQDKSKPWRFGHDIYVDHSFEDVGDWTVLPNGDQVWRMSYTSEGAYTLNFIFDTFKIPEGAKLYVYNNDRTDLLRPFTHHNNNPEEILGTWMVKGNQAWIEYYQPAGVSGTAKLVVGSVIHGYRTAETYQKDLNDSGACNQDVDCDITPASDPFEINTRKEEIKSASGMITVGGGTGICSGTLINNTNNDGTPYFMTANHCGGGEAGWAFRFNWRSPNPSCSTNAPSPNGSFDQTVSGAVVRASSSQSDMELVEISDASFFQNNSDLVWVGWNRSTTQTPTINFGIHHPSGDIQKVCREDDGAYRQVVNFNGNPNTQMWFIDQWELGVTEPGSSGSGLFNEMGQLIGVLSGGSAACSGTSNNGGFDFYGRFGVAWDFGNSQASRLADWLDPSNTGTVVLDQFPPLETFDIDARVTAGDSNPSEICNEDFMPEVTLFNPGNLLLTSAVVTFQMDLEPVTVVNWTGNLASGSSTIVATPSYSNLSPGAHTFVITVTDPNGLTDENTSNNTFVENFNVSPAFDTETVVFNILTDNFGAETSWTLTDASDTVVSSGPSSPYTNATTFQEIIAIPALDECYTFTIFDSANDGICCGIFGNGSYNLETDEGTIIISGGEFGSSESVQFKIQSQLSVNEFDLDGLITVYPNPVANHLNIRLNNLNEDVTYEMYNTLGQQILKGGLKANVSHTLDLSNQQSGIYFIKFSTTKGSLTKKIVKE